MMDASSYKDVKTSRGLTYHYFVSPAQAGKPTLLFLHGFPSTSRDWHKQVAYFKPRGYGIVVPDLLGYGGTDKPIDAEAFRASLMARDIADILDAEGLRKVIVVGHDWGTWLTSRLLNFFPERFSAAAFFAGWYMAPESFDYDKLNTETKATLGYEIFGYQFFMAEDGADKIMEAHFDTFFAVQFPHDPELWKTDFAPIGAFKKALLEDKYTKLPSYLTEEDKRVMSATLLKGGLKSPLNWYTQSVSGIAKDDIKRIPEGSHTLEQPVFFGGCLKDYICTPAFGKPATEKLCKNLTVKEYDSDHWVMFSHADAMNSDLEQWITDVIGK